jgi:hypothetical protein
VLCLSAPRAGGDGRWRINWEYVECSEARGEGSHLPVLRQGNRQLRGSQEESIMLKPGYMVTADGIRLIADVVAEQPSQLAPVEEAKAQEGGN